MNIAGLDYNTQREKLILSEYGREIQEMVHYAVNLTDKNERQRCAETIVRIMARMTPNTTDPESKKQKLWDHLAIISDFKLDIDYPVDLSTARELAGKPEPIAYPHNRIPVRHYGKMVFDTLNKIKDMEPSSERDELIRITANHMKSCLEQYGHGSLDDERIASDMAHFTDGQVQLDVNAMPLKRNSAKVVNEKKRKKR